MVCEPDYSQDIWKPLKVPDDGKSYHSETAKSINDPPEIIDKQAKKHSSEPIILRIVLLQTRVPS
jgi:hypothetical protein